jgi:hypothetical protein
MWVYTLLGGTAVPQGAFSSLEISRHPERLQSLLVRLAGLPTAPAMVHERG